MTLHTTRSIGKSQDPDAADERARDAIASTSVQHGAIEGRLVRLHPATTVLSLAISGYLTICLVFAGIGLLVTHELGPLTRWDGRVNQWFADNRTSALNAWTGDATKIADTLGILVVLAAAVIVLLVLRRRWDAVFLVVALSLELLTFLTVNFVVDRPRPDVARLGSLPSTSSYPSGHSAATFALYGGLACLVSRQVRSRIVGA